MSKLVRRYTVPQRVFHWVNVVSVGVLLVSGLGIYAPDLFGGGGVPAATWYAWHRWFAVIFLVAVGFHIVYDSFVLDEFAFMWFGKKEMERQKLIARNFLGLSKSYPKYGKYHPTQITYHWAVAANLLALVLTGLILWRPARALFPLRLLGLGWDFVYACRTLHDFFTATLMAMVIAHVYFGILIKKNWVISRSMLTGTLPYDEYARYHELEGASGLEG